MLFEIVRDDRQGDEARLRAAFRLVGPRTNQIGCQRTADVVPCLETPTRFPVVIGAGSHPFPFRTRKLSLSPPMVLHAQVCGRVGHCRESIASPHQPWCGLFLFS